MNDDRFYAAMPTVFTAADDTGDSGRLNALVSAYGVKYQIGFFTWHTIAAGAFAASIAEQPAIPLYKEHDWTSGGVPIGHATASETDDGLEIDAELYIDSDPMVKRLWESLKAGAIREYSIGYSVLTQTVDEEDDQHFTVDDAELLEASAVLRGANPATRTLQIAARVLGRAPTRDEIALLAAGRPLSTVKQEIAAPTEPVVEPLAVPALLSALRLYGTAS